MLKLTYADKGDFASGNLAWPVLYAAGQHNRELPAHVDMSECKHLKPYSIACLVALAKRKAGGLSLATPADIGFNQHLARLGFHGFFQCAGAPEVLPRSTNVPIEVLTRPSTSFSTKAMETWAGAVGGLPVGLQPLCENHIDEMILNALGHSASPIGCVVVGQAFPRKKFVDVAIVDLGQTIRGHLVKHPKHGAISTDVEAICLATREGVTGTPPGQRNLLGDPNSGAGLTKLAEFCQLGNASVSIISGYGRVCFGKTGAAIRPRMPQFFEGTLVNVRFMTGIDLPSTFGNAIL